MTPRTKTMLVALAVVAVAAGIVAELNRSPEERAAEDRAADSFHAAHQCMRAFRRDAHDPASVELAEGGGAIKRSADGRAASVTVRIRAKNPMGAIVLTTIRCDLARNGTSWDVKTLQLP